MCARRGVVLRDDRRRPRGVASVGGFAERLNDARKARKACATDLAEVLTREQAAKYKELLGPPFDLSGLGRQEQEKR